VGDLCWQHHPDSHFCAPGRYVSAAWLIGFVFIEVLVLVGNRMRCPLTDVAGHYTSDRRENFDMYLQLWLARHNKTIFGTLYGIGLTHGFLTTRGTHQ